MKKISSNLNNLKDYMKKITNNNPDYIFKEILFFKKQINVIFCESLTSRDIMNDFILNFFAIKKECKVKIKNMLDYLEKNIPINKIKKINNYEELLYSLCSGLAIIAVDGYDEVLALETKAILNSPIANAKSETVLKGPNDAFNENYQTNIGLIKRRLKTGNFCVEELIVGRISKSKVGIAYIKGIASQELIDYIKNKIASIDIDAIIDTNYIIDTINGNTNNIFPTHISTERPDFVSTQLLEGKMAIVVENSKLVAILPIVFLEMFHNPEDFYQTPINANYTKIIRYLAFSITILTPAIYIAMITYNHETISTSLLINFSMQRDGVPLPSVFEALLMILTFEILKETDARIPNIIGSSLSIVGALVLGEAAVAAGIVSPIMVIVIAITSISGFILSHFDVSNGCRWWRLLFLLLASVAGMIGVFVAGFIFLINLASTKSLGVPYLTPLAPLFPKDLGNILFVSKKAKFLKRASFFVKNNIKKGSDDE